MAPYEMSQKQVMKANIPAPKSILNKSTDIEILYRANGFDDVLSHITPGV